MNAPYELMSAQASGGNQGDYTQQSYTFDQNTGNLASKAGVSYTYGDTNHAHAVTALSNGNTYAYDANGNMTQRYISGQTYYLSYDAENHMTGVSGAASASFAYNGDGQRVISTVGGETTIFIGNYFEWHVATDLSTKYYYANATRIAMRTEAGDMQFILGDHLGSSSVMADPSGSLVSSQGYMPWGETRFGSMGTEYQYTGQYRQAAIGLDYFNARWYDPYLNQWTQPDSIIPDPYTSADWNRYSYVRYNPQKYIDPSGNKLCDGRDSGLFGGCTAEDDPFTTKELIDAISYEYGIEGSLPDKGKFQDAIPLENITKIQLQKIYDDLTSLKYPYEDLSNDQLASSSQYNIGEAIAGGLLILVGPIPLVAGMFLIAEGVGASATGIGIITLPHALSIGGFMTIIGTGTVILGGYLIYDSGCIPGLKKNNKGLQ